MSAREWPDGLDAAITVCDAAGVILEMNAGAARAFARNGGAALVGSNVLDCHPEPARAKLAELLGRPRPNTYTTEKRGRRNLVHQAPWYRDGVFAGLVEIVIALPEGMEHHVRDGA